MGYPVLSRGKNRAKGRKCFKEKIIKCAESSKETRMKKWPLDLSDGVHLDSSNLRITRIETHFECVKEGMWKLQLIFEVEGK